MYKYIKRIFFAFDAEKVHYAVMKVLSFIYKLPFGALLLRKLYDVNDKNHYTTFLGISLKNPIGLAAGFDKNAEYIDELATLGFGFIEIGTITPLPQDGNPKPRLFRLPQDEGIINRMGFNNKGVNAAVENLKRIKNKSIVIGGNIGKNKNTPNENAIHDYTVCFDKLYNYVHYFVINVSSPNTPGLRELQDKEPLTSIINALVERRKNKETIKPILLKIAPDLNYDQLNDISEIANNTELDGLVISNTTINRSNLKTDNESVDKLGAGGLSGKPLLPTSNEVLRYVRKLTSKPIIGVGGIVTGADARSKIAAGANVLQVYTGFIYQGPGIIRDLCKELSSTTN